MREVVQEASTVTTALAERQALYVPADFYMVRAPALSTEIFIRLAALASDLAWHEDVSELEEAIEQIKQYSLAIMHEWVARPEVEHALLVASESIDESLKRLQGDLLSSRRLSSRLLRYLIRMCTRATPFGLFSGVAVGVFSSRTSTQLAVPALQHMRTRPDMSWLLGLIERIEQDPALLPQLRVMTNCASYIAGSRAILPYADIYGKRDGRMITLRATVPVCYVLAQARQPIPYQQLLKNLVAAFPRASEEQLVALLRQLWEYHFLTSDLRPPLTASDPAEYVLKRLTTLSGVGATGEELQTIVSEARAIDHAGIGISINRLRAMAQKQRQLVPEKSHQPFQVDAALQLITSEINHSIADAAVDIAEVLLRVGRLPQGPQYLREYRQAFITRYGIEAEVPLLELLSPEQGLDAPATYQEPPRAYPLPGQGLFSTPSLQLQAKRDRVLCNLLTQAIQRREMEIELDDQLLQELAQWSPEDSQEPPAALEVYLQIQAASCEALDRGEWRAVVAPATMALGGRTFSRFFDILGDYGLMALQEYIRREEALEPDIIFAELSYLPTSGHAANVVVRPALRSYEIVVNTRPGVAEERVISLQDLVVGIKQGRFYVRSLRLGKEIRICQSHMLNLQRAPNVCRFLLEIAQDNRPALSHFDWGIASQAPFLPRVTRGKIVLSPAQWNITIQDIVPANVDNDEIAWSIGIQEWRARWQVPRYVYLVEFDNRLLLDLEHPLFLTELRTELKKASEQKGSIYLQEMLPDFSHLWLRDGNDAPYIAELVVPLLRHPSFQTATSFPIATPPQRSQIITVAQKRHLPGTAWTFLKLYMSRKQQSELIARHLGQIVGQLHEHGLMDRWFFVRYSDPEPHLRLRFYTSDEQQQGTLLLTALAWTRELVQQGHISRLVVDSYEQEIERYGGPEAIEIIERFFCVDSELMAALIHVQYQQQLMLDPVVVAVYCLDRLFADWGVSIEERLRFVSQRTGKYEDMEAFRGHRKLLCDLLAPWSPAINKGNNGVKDEELEQKRMILAECLHPQQAIIMEVVEHLRKLEREQKLWQSEESILASLAHMRLNRLLEMEAGLEQRVYAFWRHTLESIILRRRGAHRPARS